MKTNILGSRAGSCAPKGNDDTGLAKPAGRPPAGVSTSPEILCLTDKYLATSCSGRLSGDLHYTVFSPVTPGPHPIVFGMQGSETVT